MKNYLNLTIAFSCLCSCCNLEDETTIHLFYSCIQAKSVWSKFQELLNSEILLPQIITQIVFFFWFSR